MPSRKKPNLSKCSAKAKKLRIARAKETEEQTERRLAMQRLRQNLRYHRDKQNNLLSGYYQGNTTRLCSAGATSDEESPEVSWQETNRLRSASFIESSQLKSRHSVQTTTVSVATDQNNDRCVPLLNDNYLQIQQLHAPQQQQQQLLRQYFVTFDTQGPSSSGAVGDQGSSDPEEASVTEFEVGVITEQLAGVQDPLDNANSDQCRFCAEITKNCVDTADKPYLENNKMILTLNDLNVEIDFNVNTRKACRDCDRRLLDMFNFVKQMKIAQDALLNVSYDIEAAETLVVKIECESPTPDDYTEIDDDTKEEVKDSITIGETEFVKGNVFVNKKRKCDTDTTQRTTKELKKVKVEDNKLTSANSGLVKEEAIEMGNVASTSDTYKTVHSEDKDTGPNVKSSEVVVATNALLNEMAGASGSCEIKTEVLGFSHHP